MISCRFRRACSVYVKTFEASQINNLLLPVQFRQQSMDQMAEFELEGKQASVFPSFDFAFAVRFYWEKLALETSTFQQLSLRKIKETCEGLLVLSVCANIYGIWDPSSYS